MWQDGKMSQGQTSNLSVPDAGARNGFFGRLPKNARRTGATHFANLVEFVVVTGNASYREGEHFYLTAEQARRAYSGASAQLVS